MFLLVKKPGKIRLLVDYRALNKKIIKDAYPFPTIHKSLVKIEGWVYFSSLDLNKGYYQLSVNPKDVHKTAFCIPGGHYEFLRMPFGISTGAQTFQRIISRILEAERNVSVFIDDILLFSKDKIEHELLIFRVIDKLYIEGLSINYEKSVFCQKEISHLRMIITGQYIKLIPRGSIQPFSLLK